MYAQHWNLETNPFENDFDSAFFFPSRTHQAALLKLRYLVAGNKGCGLLIGDTGAGKSFVTKMLSRDLDKQFAPFVHVHFPVMSAAELVGYLAAQLSGDDPIEEKKKRLHYESIRISEERKSLDEEKHSYQKELGTIDDKVYADTKE